MSMDGNGLSVADALALGRDNDGMFGDGNGSWIFFLFFLLAWGGNFGNWGGNGMNSTASAYTDSAIQRGFDNQAVMNKLNGLENGICDGFYAVNATLISTLRPTPIPAYQTCSPYESAHMYSHQYNCCGC